MVDPVRRLRLAAALPLWPLLTRAVLRDSAQVTWGVTLSYLTAAFFFYVARAQLSWLGVSEKEWWHVNCKAEIAAYASMIAPQSWFFPLVVFVVVFKCMFLYDPVARVSEGGALWKCAPLALLLHPRWGYGADVIGVTLLLALRHYKSSGSEHVCDQVDFHREHERRVGVDLLGSCVLSCAGAPMATRMWLLGGTALLAGLIHVKYPRENVSYFDAVNDVNVPSYMNVPFRKVNHK